MHLYSNCIGNIDYDKLNNPRRNTFNNTEKGRIDEVATKQGQNATNDYVQRTLHIDENTPVIFRLDDVHTAAATENISACKIAIIQPEESQPDIVNLLECQEKNTIFEDTTVQLVQLESNIIFDNLELQENNKNIQNTSGK